VVDYEVQLFGASRSTKSLVNVPLSMVLPSGNF
jgi:hypothetical protein